MKIDRSRCCALTLAVMVSAVFATTDAPAQQQPSPEAGPGNQTTTPALVNPSATINSAMKDAPQNPAAQRLAAPQNSDWNPASREGVFLVAPS
jgi:hypothetical protein